MKKVIILLVALVGMISVMGQGCLPEGITFITQEQIDNFQTNYPGCTEIEGDVVIIDYTGNITNLNGLSVLISIGEDIRIHCSYGLTSLTGLHNLNFVGGDLLIAGNSALTNLIGLASLVSVGGKLWIENNFALPSLTGLESLNSIGGNLGIWNHNSLNNLSGLESLSSIGGLLSIHGNEALSSLAGLESLTSIGGDLLITSNYSLSNCDVEWVCGYLSNPSSSINIYNNASGCNNPLEVADACGIILNCLPYGNYYFFSQNDIDNFQGNYPGCTEIEGDITISGNDIANLDGLNVVNSIGDGLSIYNTAALTSLTGLESLTSIGGALRIYNNPSLTDCEAEWLCGYLSNPNSYIDIYNNASGCSNPPEIADACGITLNCLPYGNYYFHSQNEIDNFQTNYPGCTDIEGYVEISGDDIVNLNGLSVVTSIGEDLFLMNNNGLINLTGLESLTSIEGSLWVLYNDALTSLSELEGLTLIGEGINIEGNSALTSLTGLENINSSSITYLYIIYNNSLLTCDVQSICDYLAAPNGIVEINNNAPGCNSPEEVEEHCLTGIEDQSIKNEITITPNPSNDKITISLPTISGIIQLSIFNVSGEKVLEKHLKDTEIQLDISGLPRGVYIVRVQDEEMTEVMKLIKQ